MSRRSEIAQDGVRFGEGLCLGRMDVLCQRFTKEYGIS